MVGQPPEIVVIESRSQPTGGVVAARSGAVGGETRSDVVGNRATEGDGTLPGRNVAAIAVRRQTAGIVAADVASRARCFGGVGVGAGEREASGAVIKFPRSPGGDGMARSALCRGNWEPGGNVVRNVPSDGHRAIKRCRVATITIGGIQRVIVADVASGARSRRGRHVRAYQREAGDAVIKRSGIPARSGVACRTIGRSKCRAG